MDYVIVKTVHVVSSVVLVGTGFGTAFFLYSANRSGSVAAIATVARLAVRADWYFTTPAVILQPLTGALMIWQASWPVGSRWIVHSLLLYTLAGACWLPVVACQLRMARLSESAHRAGVALPAEYWRLARRWELLGYPAFLAMLAVFYLMVAKPV